MVPHPTCCKQLRLTKSSANFNKDLLFTRFVNFNLQQDDVRLEPQLYYRELICNCKASIITYSEFWRIFVDLT